MIKSSQIRLADVAAAVGVSKASVSQALNLSAEECPLKSETREKILDAVKRLGYRPSWHARVMAKRRTMSIGLLFYGFRPPLSGIYEDFLKQLSEDLQVKGYHILLVPVNDRGEWQNVVREGRIDGFVGFHYLDHDILKIVHEVGLPNVLVNVESTLPLNQILLDDYGGMTQLMNYLLSLGHKRIGYVQNYYPDPHYSLLLRYKAYRDAMKKAGHELMINDGGDVDDYLGRYMKSAQKPTALVCYTHTEAMMAISRLNSMGYRIPDDVSVAAFNDVPALTYQIPPVTTMAVSGENIGKISSDLLFKQIESESPVPCQTLLMPEQLILRTSVGPPKG